MKSPFIDKRGKILFPITNSNHFKQCNVSYNKKNVFRGIHINSFDKLVTCIQGKILDITVNFDESSSDYLIPKYYELDPNTDNYQLFIPKNIGHAFLSLEENSIVLYHLESEFKDEETKHIHFLDPYINLSLPVMIEQLILSDKDNIKNFIKPIDYLVFGPNGFLGTTLVNILKSNNKHFITSTVRLSNIEKIKNMIELYLPKYIINCAGITGYPNMFWCDNHKLETIETNITYQLTLAHLCNEKNIHLTIFGSGGIFNHDKIYEEEEDGNHHINFYGICRSYLEKMIKNYNNVLYLRINYPIADKPCNKNLLTKLLSYKTIDPCEVSITYVNDLFPILIQMIENHETGICNFTNPGTIYLTDIMNIYEKITDKKNDFQINTNFDIHTSKRSFAKLKTDKINKYIPLTINDAIEKCIQNYIQYSPSP